jgi:hypothetical protein
MLICGTENAVKVAVRRIFGWVVGRPHDHVRALRALDHMAQIDGRYTVGIRLRAAMTRNMLPYRIMRGPM